MEEAFPTLPARTMSANLVDYDADIIDNTTLSEPDYVDKPPPWETAATAQIAGVRVSDLRYFPMLHALCDPYQR